MKMSIITILLICFTVTISNGQDKKGFIIDPDGYTNVREYADSKSKIISEIIDGEIFKYNVNESSWYPVETYAGIEGFVHKSRIKEFKITKNLCLNENMKELLLYRKSGKIISVCGIPFKNKDGIDYFSGLLIGDGLNKIKYQEFFEGDIQSFSLQSGQIIVYEYSNLPIDKDFNVNLVAYSMSRTFFNGEKVINIVKAPFYDFPKIDNEQIKTEMQKMKHTRFYEKDYYNVINKALVFALNNEMLAQGFLYNLESKLDISFDGEYGEKYTEALLIYEINKTIVNKI